MSEASYDRQHLAVHAAGFISANGATATTFGCTMTRLAEGQYAMVLDSNSGVVNDESFTEAIVKGVDAAATVVEDTSDTVKTINVFSGGSNADGAVEVILFKTVTR